jgi:hypothetical protein
MKRFTMLAATTLLATAAVTLVTIDSQRVAYAQPAMALGKPLEDGSLPVGTVSVRIVAGAPSNPVIGTDVTLLVNGEPRVARTDSAGRAMFPGLPAGAAVQAKVAAGGEKKEDIASETFPVPATGGVRVMLTTKPFQGGAMPPMAGGAGMPEARQMSGQPRPDRMVPPGSYQIRVTYNNLQIKDGEAVDSEPPVGESVTVVGYSYDESVTAQTMKVDAKGHAQFDGLDVGGNLVYFALTRLPRNGNVDRLASVPVQLETQAGAKLILSSDKRTSTVPQIDDLAGTASAALPPAGKVKITLEGYPRELSEITLFDAVTKQVVGKGKPQIAPPDPSKVDGDTRFEADKSLPAGTVDVRVHGGAGNADTPLPDIAVRVVPIDATNVAEGIASKTAADGSVRLAVAAPAKKHRLLFDVNGKELASGEFDLSASGGKLEIIAHWEDEGHPQVVFDVPYNPAQVLYAETRQVSPLSKQLELYRSMPFQTLEQVGAYAPISILPRILFSFQLQSFVEDEIFGVRGLWRVMNNSWIPYRDSADGLVIKLPKGHVGGIVGDEFQAEVSVAPGEGFRILRPLPPGSTQFEAGFSLKSDEGDIHWHLDLPLGAFQSMVQIREFPNLDVELPQGVTGDWQTGRSGTKWFTVDDIMIPTNKSMVMTIHGLPTHPAWKKWVPRFVGILVVLIMIGGIVFAMMRKRSPDEAITEARKRELMDELVELEKTNTDSKRREQVLSELERMWD